MLPYSTSFIDNQAIIGILRRACNYVDHRLMDHGIRVSYIVFRLLSDRSDISARQRRDLCFLAALHDIGAYKTDEIDRMVQFETENVWHHSIYGHLFIKYFSPLPEQAAAVLFHHTSWQQLAQYPHVCLSTKYTAQLLQIADRLDIWLNTLGRPYKEFLQELTSADNQRFYPPLVDWLLTKPFKPFTAEDIENDAKFQQMQNSIAFTSDEIHAYLCMIIYAIDFRSRHTVTHTMTTTSISHELAVLMELDTHSRNEVILGALLHDLGKIAIPVEILEFPGKLSPQAMTVMRTHVALTEAIFADAIPEPIQRIAIRHHEKLDGSGYPRGLAAEELTTAERIVSIADIVSALSGTRSYKEAFSKEKTLAIITTQKEKGQLDPLLVDSLIAHYDKIMAVTMERCQPIIDIYQRLHIEYAHLIDHFS